MKLLYTLVICLAASLALSAQDTLTLLHHNILNYGNNTWNSQSQDGCNTEAGGNNEFNSKERHLKTIVKYTNPDIYSIDEIGSPALLLDRIMANVLNTDGVTKYAKTQHVPETNPNAGSALFYNKNKLGLSRQLTINSIVRKSLYFRFYYKSNRLEQGDTVFLHYVVSHLKAGNTPSDESQRASMVVTIQEFLRNIPANENCFFAGDFNVYRSSEVAFQAMIAPATGGIDFIDPINRIGSWSGNSTFADVHTQSTQRNGNGCTSGGGLDDRFDWILMNEPAITGTAGLQYITGSYKAVGNDGQHFNRSINEAPNNTSAPANVINAIANASDHLPVIAKVRMFVQPASLVSRTGGLSTIQMQQQDGKLAFYLKSGRKYSYSLIASAGKMLRTGNWQSTVNPETISLSGLAHGVYLVTISDLSTGEKKWFRVVK